MTLIDEMTADAAPSEDKLDRLRAMVRQQRDLEATVADLEEQLKDAKKQLFTLGHETMPELFTAAGVDHVGIPREGNHPAYDAELGPYYKANIAVDWPDEKRAAAFRVLEEAGAADLIKTEVVVTLGRGDRALAKKVRDGLTKAGVPFTERLTVHWGTLTAWVRELVEKRKRTPPPEIEAQVGQVVKLKERKEK